MMDLTTLEGADTPGKVAALCDKAMRPDPVDTSVPSVAAVCVYPNLVPVAKKALEGIEREGRLGRDRLPVRPVAARRQARRTCASAVELGADEIDMVIDRGAFLSGRLRQGLRRDRRRSRRPAATAHLKVILETGELGTYDNVRRASRPRDGRGRRLHQDLDRQGRARPRRCR